MSFRFVYLPKFPDRGAIVMPVSQLIVQSLDSKKGIGVERIANSIPLCSIDICTIIAPPKPYSHCSGHDIRVLGALGV